MSKLNNLTEARHIADGLESAMRAAQSGKLPVCPVPYQSLHRWREKLRRIVSLVRVERVTKPTIKLLFQPGALWIGAHYSKDNRRWCINLLPCVTICYTKVGGISP